jgi:hypothetical protein
VNQTTNNQSTTSDKGGTTMETIQQTIQRIQEEFQQQQQELQQEQLITAELKELSTYKKNLNPNTTSIPVIVQEGLDYNQHFNRLKATYPTEKFHNVQKYLDIKYNKLKETYIQNIYNQYAFIPEVIYPQVRQTFREEAIRKVTYYQLFNYTKMVIITDYQPEITKTDSGFPKINKPKLNKATYNILKTFISQDLENITMQHITLVDSNTLASAKKITKYHTMDDILTDFSSEVLSDPLGSNSIDLESIINTEFYELAQLYDIDPQYKNLVTHQRYHSNKTHNTFTNVYPRSYPTEATLTELQQLVQLYKEYNIINDETTQILREQKSLTRTLEEQQLEYEEQQAINHFNKVQSWTTKQI